MKRILGWAGQGATLLALMVAMGSPANAQGGSGDGFLFREPVSTVTFHGGLALPRAGGALFDDVTRDLTLARSDFAAASFGMDLAFAVTSRVDVVVGFGPSSSRTPSEFRDWVDNNDQPIAQETAFLRSPVTLSARYHLRDKGRMLGSYAWIPRRVVPFVSAGGGLVRYRFEQKGDFIDLETLNVFRDELRTSGWTWVGQVGAGAHLSLSPRVMLTGEARYLLGGVDAGRSSSDYVGYRLDLSGLTTLVGFSLRL